jgi:hypothetical protein
MLVVLAAVVMPSRRAMLVSPSEVMRPPEG